MRVTTHYTLHRRLLLAAATVLTAFMVSATPSEAMTDVYQLSQSIGKSMDMTGATKVYGRSSAVASSTLKIGFTFKFDGKDYSTFSVNTSGAMSLGVVTQRYYYPYYFPNYPSTGSSYYLGDKLPFLAPFWMYVGYPTTASGAGVYYKLSGSSPNRVLTVEWRDVFMYGNSASTTYSGGTFQARLYEGSNKIEYYYDKMVTGRSYYASIGMISSNTRYINIWGNDINEYYLYPSGGYYSYRYPSSYPMVNGTLFTFNPCEKTATIKGDLANGGTAKMEANDILVNDEEVQRGSTGTLTPFSITNPSNGCDPIKYSVSFSGAAAADYSVSSGVIGVGETVTPRIIFTPGAVGNRGATMRISMSNGQNLIYNVAADGTTRIDWIADVAEGGVNGMPSGANLLTNIDVNRDDSRDLMPFTLENINPDKGQFPAKITYILDDPLDEYSLDLPGGTVTGGATQQTATTIFGLGGASTPTITFEPHPNGSEYGAGTQEATLTVIADGERRVFTLAGFSVAPAFEMMIGDTRVITSDRNFFRNVNTCVGEVAEVLTMTVENINKTDVTFHSLNILAVDGTIQQGTPRYPQVRDIFGNLVESHDYVLSTAPGVAPARDNPEVRFPMTLKPGETKTLYLTYVAQRPGKRYARAFLSTNAVNFFSPDVENFTGGSAPDVEGLMTMEFYGRGLGSNLAKDMSGDLEGLAMVFDPVKVGESVEAETTVYNTGECDLRISQDRAKLTTGDVTEFELLEVFNGATLQGQDYVIPAGGSATLKARFTPSRSGSRRATVMMETNDSLLGDAGINDRGVFYMNLYGVGRADLRTRDITLDPAVIDGPGSQGVVRLVNTSSEVIEVTGAALQGASITEITEDASNMWPALPVQMQPGDALEFGVSLNAASGSAPGVRSAEMVFTYGSGETVSADISGLVGTRELMATPATLFEGVEVPVGTTIRQTAILTNTGTFPVRINDIRVEGASAVDYEVRRSGRGMIGAGGFEFIEVTYTPSAAGASAAMLVIDNNSTGGQVTIMLDGAGMSTVEGGGSSGSEGARQEDGATGSKGQVGTILELGLGSIVPNPASGMVTIEYGVAEGRASLGVYNVRGELVLPVETVTTGGTQSAKVDVSSLPNGVYLCRLEQGGRVVVRSMTVVN